MILNSGSFKDRMAGIKIPQETKDDIAYCQRSLRNFIKVQQMLVAKLVIGQTEAETTKIKGYLNEIESEITEIGKEQKSLFLKLTELLDTYIQELNDDLVEVDKEMAYGCVSRILSNHYEAQFTSNNAPHELTERLSENELLEKYELTQFEDYMRKEREETFTNLINSTIAAIPPTITKPKNEQSHRTYNNTSRTSIKRSLNESGPYLFTPKDKFTKINTQSSGPIMLSSKIDTSSLGLMLNTVESLKPTPKPKNITFSSRTIAIKSSRMNLLQALAKAKDKKSKPSEEITEKSQEAGNTEFVDTRIENYIIEEDLPSSNSNADNEIAMEETLEMLDGSITAEQ